MIDGTYETIGCTAAIYPDKRKTHDWRAREVKAGTVFHVHTLRSGRQECWTGDHQFYCVDTAQPEAKHLLALLRRLDDTPGHYFDRVHNGYGATNTLNQLVKDGTLTMDQVVAACEAYYAESES